MAGSHLQAHRSDGDPSKDPADDIDLHGPALAEVDICL